MNKNITLVILAAGMEVGLVDLNRLLLWALLDSLLLTIQSLMQLGLDLIKSYF